MSTSKSMILRAFLCLCTPMVWGLIDPLTNPQGEITLQQLAHHMTSVEYLLQNLTSQVQVLTTQLNSLKQKQDVVVSFKAFASAERRVSVGSITIFDHVESNIGHGYNPTSGVFHAPVAGIYTFSTQMEAIDGGVSEYSIVQQGIMEAVITIIKAWDSKSTTAIFHLNAGDDVYVKKITDNTGNARLRSGQWTQFSGHLLRAD